MEHHRLDLILCVDDYVNGVLQGRLYRPDSNTGWAFTGMSRLLRRMEQLLDAPVFDDGPPVFRSPVIPPGGVATLSVAVLFRQNASWQGRARWLEGECEQSFRSALELILWLDAILGEADRPVA